jgi:hypothetical protein
MAVRSLPVFISLVAPFARLIGWFAQLGLACRLIRIGQLHVLGLRAGELDVGEGISATRFFGRFLCFLFFATRGSRCRLGGHSKWIGFTLTFADAAQIHADANPDASSVVMRTAATAWRAAARTARATGRFRENISDEQRTKSDQYDGDFHLFSQGSKRQDKCLTASDDLQFFIGRKSALRPVDLGVSVIAVRPEEFV